MNRTVTVELTCKQARWLDQKLQDDFKRQGFRPHESADPLIVEVGEAVQRAIEVDNTGASHAAE